MLLMGPRGSQSMGVKVGVGIHRVSLRLVLTGAHGWYSRDAPKHPCGCAWVLMGTHPCLCPRREMFKIVLGCCLMGAHGVSR